MNKSKRKKNTAKSKARKNRGNRQRGLQSRSYWLSLEFAGPLMSQASGTLSFGVDTAMQRYRGQPVINGSLIRGNLRHALLGFAELLDDDELANKITLWFGAPSDDGFEPRRTNIDFDFFWQANNAASNAPSRRTRIAIEDTGKVRDQHLQVIEDAFPLGGAERPVFRGVVTIHYRLGSDRREMLHWLGRALDYIPAMGSFKGIGFGRLSNWSLEELPSDRGSKRQPTPAERVGFELRFATPFCLGRPRTPDSNRIVSDEVVSGNVLKGILARKLNHDRDRLAALGFDQLVIAHAVPAPQASPARAIPVPLSLAVMGDRRVVDMACVTEVGRLRLDQAPLFRPDWKHDDHVTVEQAWYRDMPKPHAPGRLLSVRTEINAQHNVAEEGNLFSHECIDPHETVWCGDFDLRRVPAEKRGALLDQLTGQLYGIGKTRARATLTLRPSPFSDAQMAAPFDGDHYLVLLCTPARLLPPGAEITAINGYDALRKAYGDYWQTRVHRDIEMLNHFSRQSLASDWPHRQRHGVGGEHRATWLTTAGSVFLLRVPSAQGREALANALRGGLPAALEADGSEPDWRTTPWLPEHGFGEIAVNHPRQLALRYSPEEKAQ